MAFVLWLGAAALLIVSVALGHDDASFPVRVIAAAAGWIGIPLLVVSVIHSYRARIASAMRNALTRIEGPALIRAMPPRLVLESLLSKTLGNRHGHQEII